MPETWPASTIFTIGHSTRPLAEFISLLRPLRVDCVVDIRSIPKSRHNPQYNADALAATLAVEGIGYRHIRALGGLRAARKDKTPSANMLWRNVSFRNFADFAATGGFAAGLNELRGLALDHRCAIMCAEAAWWRCHRRIITDYLLSEGRPVGHLMGPGDVAPAILTPGAQIQADGTIVYPAPSNESELPLFSAGNRA